MRLKDNLYYWTVSLQNPEPIFEELYFSDKIIVEDQSLIEVIRQLRALIVAYCINRSRKISSEENRKILQEIYSLIIQVENLQYTEFLAFWKSLDLSYSVFEVLDEEEQLYVLEEALKVYCDKRLRLYERLGYSNIVVQALYDSGSSRRKSNTGVNKVLFLIAEIFNGVLEVNSIEDFERNGLCVLLPDKNKELLNDLIERLGIEFKFRGKKQNKNPDVVLKVADKIFIIEAKHIKEGGGAQDKQIGELIDFISHPEDRDGIHYVSFLDGFYFNKFIAIERSTGKRANKVLEQKLQIEKLLREFPNNFFVNTAGLRELLLDLAQP